MTSLLIQAAKSTPSTQLDNRNILPPVTAQAIASWALPHYDRDQTMALSFSTSMDVLHSYYATGAVPLSVIVRSFLPRIAQYEAEGFEWEKPFDQTSAFAPEWNGRAFTEMESDGAMLPLRLEIALAGQGYEIITHWLERFPAAATQRLRAAVLLSSLYRPQKKLLQSVLLTDIRHEPKKYPLHQAICNGSTTGAIRAETINQQTSLGMTPLHLAAYLGDSKAVQSLIEAGATIDLADRAGATALHRAAQGGDKTCVRALIKAGANVHATDVEQNTPLHYAAEYNAIAAAKVLLENGADAKQACRLGHTALHRLAHQHDKNCKDFAELLVKAGADSNALAQYSGSRLIGEFILASPLSIAIAQGNVRLASVLLDCGAKTENAPPQQDILILQPLQAAAAHGHTAMVKMLLNAGAQLEQAVTGTSACTKSQHVQCPYDAATKLPVTPYLHPVNSPRHIAGDTALVLAVRERMWEAASTLLQAGARTKQARAMSDLTAEERASLQRPSRLREAVRKGKLAQVKHYIEKRALSPNLKSRTGQTLLDLAREAEHEKVVQYLIRKGALVACKLSFGK